MRGLALTIAIAGCTTQAGASMGPAIDPVPQPDGCAMQLALDGAAGSQPASVGPLVLDAAGVNLCLHLDATHNVRAHFAAATDYQPGATSPYTATLQDATRTPIGDGWDVTVGDRTFENLEWDAPAGQMTDVVLWVRAPVTAPATGIDVALFEPFE